jgi:hypothetical protein
MRKLVLSMLVSALMVVGVTAQDTSNSYVPVNFKCTALRRVQDSKLIGQEFIGEYLSAERVTKKLGSASEQFAISVQNATQNPPQSAGTSLKKPLKKKNIIICGLFFWKGDGKAGLTRLTSAKVNLAQLKATGSIRKLHRARTSLRMEPVGRDTPPVLPPVVTPTDPIPDPTTPPVIVPPDPTPAIPPVSTPAIPEVKPEVKPTEDDRSPGSGQTGGGNNGSNSTTTGTTQTQGSSQSTASTQASQKSPPNPIPYFVSYYIDAKGQQRIMLPAGPLGYLGDPYWMRFSYTERAETDIWVSVAFATTEINTAYKAKSGGYFLTQPIIFPFRTGP